MADAITTAGDSLAFDFSLPEFPASDGWAGTVHLRSGSTKATVTLAASGDRHAATVPPAITASWLPGIYELAVTVARDSERSVAYESRLIVRPDPAAACVAKTALESELAAVDAAIAAVLAGEGVQSYTIQTVAGSRQIQRMSLEDLRDHRRYLEGKIDVERAAMGQRPRNQRWRRIGVKF